MDDGISHRLADGGLDIPQLVQCGVQLGGKGSGSCPGKALVAAAAEKFNGHIIFSAGHM